MGQLQHWFLHVDLDAFFASVEQLDHPEYRGKPVIVGGKPDDRRSVVSTASYEARAFGVHSAMPTAQAYKLCPQGIFVHGRMERYAQISYNIMEILKNYSPDVDQMSIDEAFLDITGTEKLFGPPETVAQKIKLDIKEQTGLTVSIGLAQSKYHAKIASDINKPDGFYFVKPGTEENFMLNLPLKKVFGIGNKTLQKLNNCGIKTTRDIHEKSLEWLQFMCGENQGFFLYNVVRGKFDDNRFGNATKSHSISAETTFAYDVTDCYTLETVILNLAYSIFFRLLKEQGYSRTAFVKIRYEDFSTVSIQQTFEKNISNLDFYYEILKELFEKKWEKNIGVRLIGVGLENIEKEDKPMQQELFDDATEKKQKVEKAILSMSQKHPELKVHKARMMENLKNNFKSLLLIVFLSTSLFSHPLHSQETTDDFFKYNISGFWETGFSGNFLSTFGNNTEFAFSPAVPVFKQNVDLTADFSLGSNWNFYINFADNFNKNTYTISFTGQNYLKNFVFSNRNIIFPKDYSSSQLNLNPGGGNNEAPGILFRWEDKKNSKYQADFILRYDMTTSEAATFYGKNKVSDITISPSAYIQGRFFIIPDSSAISQIQDIYIETESSLPEAYYLNGQKFRKLDSSEYLILTESKLLILSKSAAKKINEMNPKIIVTFTEDSILSNLKSTLGSYGDQSSYLGKIQTYFSSYNKEINLEDYAYDLNARINNKNGLLIQNNKGFSPFNLSSVYETGKQNTGDIFVINTQTKQKISDYKASTLQFDFIQLAEDFFQDKTKAVTIYLAEIQNNDFSLPENRYPFTISNPFIYLTSQSDEALSILNRSYSLISNYDIGKDVEASSIKVLINGIPTQNFTYSQTSGFVSINQNVYDSDRIDITWNKQASNADNGTIISAAGFKYFISPSFSTDVTLSLRIPFNPFVNYGTYNTNLSSYASLTGGLQYKKNNISIENITSIGIENPNLTNCFIANKINTSGNKTYYNEQKSAAKTQTTPKLKNCDTCDTCDTILDPSKKSDVLSTIGESDSQISGYKIPVEWNFINDENWTSIDFSLSQADLLCNSNKFEFAIKNESSEEIKNYKIYFQLGILKENNIIGYEENIPTWDITSQIDFSASMKNQWQKLTIQIKPEEQALLTSQKDGRIIIYKNDGAPSKGKISFGPYKYYKNGITTKANSNLNVVSTLSYSPSANSAKNYLKSDFYSDMINWNIKDVDSITNIEDAIITAHSYFQPASFSDYEIINLDFSIIEETIIEKTITPSPFPDEDSPALTFILDDFPSEKQALKLMLSQNLITSIAKDSFHTLKINTRENKVYIDDDELSSEDYDLYVNKTVAPSRQIIQFNTYHSKISKGSLLLGSLYYTNADYYLNLQNLFKLDYKKDKIIVNKDEKNILHNAYLSFTSRQAETVIFNSQSPSNFYTDALTKTGISVLKTDFSTYFLIDYSSKDSIALKNFGYNIKNNDLFFNFMSLSESYDYNKQNFQMKKEDNISFNFAKLKLPLEMAFSTINDISSLKKQQKYNSNLNFELPIKTTKLSSKTNIMLSQKTTVNDTLKNTMMSFEEGWITSLQEQFSSGNPSADYRNIQIKTNFSYEINKNLIPQVTYLINTNTNNIQNQNFDNTTNFTIAVPFKIKNNAFSFSYSKKGTLMEENTECKSYADDFQQLFNSSNNQSWFYATIPFYDLFDTSITNKLQDNDYKQKSFNSKYQFSWKRPLYSSVKDLFIPMSVSTSISRDVIAASNINDIYQIKTSLNYNFINLLGRKGKLNLFDFFNQDEYSSNITAQFKIPSTGNNITWSVTFNEALLLYINNTNTIKIASDFNISEKETWELKLSSLWTHDGNDSILIMIPALFYKKINDYSKSVIRKEDFSFMIGQDKGKLKQEYKYCHSCEALINNKVTISNSLGTTFNYTEEKALSLNLEYYLGAKLTF